MRISVLGAGNMGTALADMLAKKGHSVTLWTIEDEVFRSISEKKENSKYLPGVELSGNLTATMDLQKSVAGADIVVFAVPSQVTREVAKSAAKHLTNGQILVNAAKGLETGTNKLMSEVIREEIPNNPSIAIGGPSIANELARETPTAVVFASEDENALRKAQEAFSMPFYKVYLSRDIIGVELCGAFKNIFALLAGMCDGLGFGANTKAALVTLGLAEISQLAVRLGAEPVTLTGLAGLGDLFVTATSEHSRNRTLGEKLGKGMQLKDALAGTVQVSEGVAAAKVARGLALAHKLDLPLLEMIYGILFEDKTPKEAIAEFMGEVPEEEFD